MKHLEVLCVLTFAITFATTSPINQEKDPKAESGKDVPKGKSLIIAEPLYKPHDLEIVPEYHNEPVINYYHVDGLGKRGVVVYPTGNPSDMEVAESNIVFRPLFAYRKQMEKNAEFIYKKDGIEKHKLKINAVIITIMGILSIIKIVNLNMFLKIYLCYLNISIYVIYFCIFV